MRDTAQAMIVESHIRLTARVQPEAIAFFQAHGCDIQRQAGRDTVIFPAGSRQEPMSATSKRCSHIFLPDGTCITAMDCDTRFILLLLDPVQRSCVHLSR